MVQPNSKDDAVICLPHQVPLSRLAAVGLILSACLLGGCGRKGPLDLPPAAANAPVAPAASDEETAPAYRTQSGGANAADPGLFGSASTSNGPMAAPRGEKKRIILDPILD